MEDVQKIKEKFVDFDCIIKLLRELKNLEKIRNQGAKKLNLKRY